MGIATETLKDDNLSRSDYEQMADYIRCKEYNNGIIDALQIIKNCDTLEEATRKLTTINEYCEKMRYVVIQRIFEL